MALLQLYKYINISRFILVKEYSTYVMSHESHLGPTCGAGEKAGDVICTIRK